MASSALDELFNAEGGGDFLSAEDLGGLPSVDLIFEVTKAEPTNSSAGDPMLKLTMRVADGPLAGKTQMARYTFKTGGSEAGKSIVWRSLQALGITREFAQAVAAGVPDGSQIVQLFIESAKRINATKPRVRANVAPEGGTTKYADRVQVNYDLKTAPQAENRPVAPVAAAPTVPAAPTAADVAALQAQVDAAVATPPAPQVDGLSIGVDTPSF